MTLQHLYFSEYVPTYQKEIIEESLIVSDKVCRLYDGMVADHRKGVYKYSGNLNSTWLYPVYNIFAAASPSNHFYYLNGFINSAVKNHFHAVLKYPPDTQIWMQSWINFHSSEDILKKHNHLFSWHGYISIDPKDSKTVFFDKNGKENYYVENKPGLMYIGPGDIYHEVRLNTSMQNGDHRITLAFNIMTSHDPDFSYNMIDGSSFIPVF